MKAFPIWFAVACMMLAAPAAFGQEPAHEHDVPGLEGIELDNGKAWPTDAPLREAMTRVRGAVRQAHPGRGLGAGQAAVLAGQVRTEVEYMIANCKLPPRADANLHRVIAHLLRGAQQLENADPAERGRGVATVQEALRAYGAHFQHPGWHTPKAP